MEVVVEVEVEGVVWGKVRGGSTEGKGKGKGLVLVMQLFRSMATHAWLRGGLERVDNDASNAKHRR